MFKKHRIPVIGVFLCFLFSVVPSVFAQKTILIVAPHPDDEALMASGIIYEAKARGDTVKVVVVTNGDNNGVSVGYQRENETMAAMAVLGLGEQDVIFMGYGDQSVLTLYRSTSPTTIYTSNAGRTQTYADRGLGGVDYHTYLYGVPGDYNRQTILGDFKALLANFQPAEIYTTAYYDDHPDHKGTDGFVTEALLALKRDGTNLQTRIHEMIVHSPCQLCDPNYVWPEPSFQPTQPFPEPPTLDSTPYKWDEIERVPVPAPMQDPNQATNLKYAIISNYPSQNIPYPAEGWLFSFVRKDEFFWVRNYATNIAATATVSDSYGDPTDEQSAIKAIDGIVDGYPGDDTKEWATTGQSVGAWIRLTWPTSYKVSQVVLHDRPNLTDQVLAGTLSFSDGSTVSVGTLPNNGSGLAVNFTPRTVTWVQFQVTNAAGQNIGLSEIEVYGTPANATYDTPPQIYQGPVAASSAITDAQSTNLNVSAFDVDGDTLQYDWTADGGTVTGSGANAVFHPPTVTTETVFTITVTVSDGRGGTAQNSQFITVAPGGEPVVELASLSLDPMSVIGGATSTGTVILTSPAPSGGATVSLSSSNPSVASVPSEVTVPEGVTSATFTVTTSPVTASTQVTISAGYGDDTTLTALLTVEPGVTISSLTLNPSTAPSGGTSQGTVTLSGPAPAGGTVVTLSSTNTSVATVPASVTVPSGSTSATFAVTVQTVTISTSVDISASYGGQTRTATLIVQTAGTSNLASLASVTVSSQNTSTGQLGIKAIDGIVDGYPGDYTKEWATVGQLAGAWIRLTWSSPLQISQVVLYDRPNLVDNVLAGTLSFSDGTTVSVGPLPNDGTGLPVTFATRTVTWIQFQVTSAVGSNIGLAEINVFGSSGAAVSGLTVNPTTATGGSSSQGTVTLSAEAPAGGAVVTLSSNNTAVASVPASVIVPAGSTSASFNVSTSTVTTSAQVTLSASYGGATQTATLTVVPAITASSLTLNPSTVTGGSSSQGTVTLSSAAPVGGAVVSLSSDNTAVATVPASVTVPAGSTSANFDVSTSTVTSSTQVTLSASYGGATQTATLTVVHAITAASLSLSPTTVTGGNPSQGTVTLSGPAPTGGAIVTLSSNNNAVATVPASVTVPAGSTSANFTISTTTVTTSTQVALSASYGGATQTATLTVVAATAVSSLTLNPATVTAGGSSQGTVTLSGAAPTGGAVVTLSSTNTSVATVPASVTVPSGSTSATFAVTAQAVTTSTSVDISASYGGQTRTATLDVQVAMGTNLASLASVTVSSQNTSTGQLGIKAIDGIVDGYPGDYTKEWATVGQLAGAWIRLTWSSPVQVSQVVLYDRPNLVDNVLAGTLSFSDGSTVSVGTLPNDGTGLPVPFATRTVTWIQFQVTSAVGSNIGLAEINVLGASGVTASSLTLNPVTVTGGGSSQATVMLSGPAPTGGASVFLSSANTAVATVPASVTVPAGSTSANFAVSTSTVTSSIQVTLSASYGGVTPTATLTVVTATAVSSLTLNPATVTAGGSSQGTVTLSGAAPSGGAVVTLSSSNTSVATVPASVTVPSGSTSATFTVTAQAVTASTSVDISASYGGQTRTATLIVQTAATSNLASLASVTVSSQNTSTGQLGIKAIDGIVDGYPGDYTKEWATVGQLAGAWIRLTWSSPVQVSQVVLYDRPNLVDNVLAGTLSFSDGSTVSVGALPNNGTGLSVPFATRTVTWIQFQVTSAVGSNIGLAEINVLGSSGSP